MRYSAFLGSSFRLPALLSLASLTCFVTNLSHGESVEYSEGSTALNFGSANVCPAGQSSPSPCSNTLTLSYSIAANTTISGVAVLTDGAKLLDFQPEPGDASTTLCSAKTYSAASTCTVDVKFAPLTPGLRKGAIQILNGN